jgi:hypothetical protein
VTQFVVFLLHLVGVVDKYYNQILVTTMAVPQSGRIEFGVLPRRPGFEVGATHVGSVLDRAAP